MPISSITNQKIQQTRKPKKRKPTKKQAEQASPSDKLELSAQKPQSTRVKVSPQQQATSNLQSNLAANLPPTLAQPIAESFKTGFIKGYLTPSTIEAQCEKLAQDFPDLVDLVKTGITTHGYDGSNKEAHGTSELFYLRLGPKTENRDKKTGIFQYAAPHARERMNPMSMMELAHQLVNNYDPSSTDPKVQANTALMNDLDIYIAINTNPDGHNFAAFDDPMWRKNRAPLEGGEYGVDINRNYPYQWEKSDDLSSIVYSGSGPASEPETQALVKVTADHPNIKFVVDWHSYGREIRRPLGVSESDGKLYDTMHGRVQQAMKSVTDNDYTPVVSQVTEGTSDDFFYHTQGMYSTVMETGTDFTPSEPEALEVMKESVEGAREFLRVARDYAEGNLSSQAQ
ncbi:MAG: hypothetical protein KC800_24425 [Candidatus Eremiobacteraeota bacterium]|nr:hypothetical protein [Candidatus Eremiobacteraeota bacterium]